MKGYSDLSTLYDKKFLNYIISRSRALSKESTLDYEDLVQDGLLKLVVLHARHPRPGDPIIMKALVNMYNTSYTVQKSKPTLVPYDDGRDRND